MLRRGALPAEFGVFRQPHLLRDGGEVVDQPIFQRLEQRREAQQFRQATAGIGGGRGGPIAVTDMVTTCWAGGHTGRLTWIKAMRCFATKLHLWYSDCSLVQARRQQICALRSTDEVFRKRPCTGLGAARLAVARPCGARSRRPGLAGAPAPARSSRLPHGGPAGEQAGQGVGVRPALRLTPLRQSGRCAT